MSKNKTNKNPENVTYQDAGVSIKKAGTLIKKIKNIANKTKRTGVMNEIGSFSAFFEIPPYFQQPVLVSSTDGVGTKLKLAHALNRHEKIGIDLVAMCVNDIICHGAEPLFFLDYYATGKLDISQSEAVIQGIGQACKLIGAALIGGETAEMPGMYEGNDYDLAGFCVGAVEKNKLIDGKNVSLGDSVIALASSGPHSNGYSLIRKVVERCGASYHDKFENDTLGNTLLTPTRMYVNSILGLIKHVEVHGIANITGGGLTENIPRCIPKNLKATIDDSSWKWPPIFEWLQKKGNIKKEEMKSSFNLGVGMVIIVPKNQAQKALDFLKTTSESAWIIGSIQEC